MKLCVDCKHYRLGDECSVLPQANPVNGKPIYTYAYTQRMTSDKCGLEAKWFELIQADHLDDLSTIPFGR
jgi:hypothetical protein